jgi:cytochrome c5
MNILAALLLCAGLTAGAVMASVEDRIRSRVEPVGTVCVQGEDCGDIAVSAPAQASSGEPRSGEEVYGSVCQSCHAAGVAGAPITGETSAWSSRVDKGMETLVSNAVNGYNAMPAKGGCASCPEEEIASAVEYMVDQSK